jgi:NAD(P)-dependent dehydrogenase (short-subunit alcohol dehydrogenase family)
LRGRREPIAALRALGSPPAGQRDEEHEVDLGDRIVVVTGGGSGIGRAMALRFLDEGARGVTVADLDGASAEAVAAEGGSRAVAFAGDVADPDAIAQLLERTQDAFGPVDLYCANAGVARGTGPDTPEEDWELSFEVNVRAHIRAARALLPGWLERGEGYFLATASAAGLLTQIGSAPYAVSKHAAVAFAEWLSVTYGERGVRVSCLCPMGVNTPLLHGDPSVSDDERLPGRIVAAAGDVLEAEQVAEVVVEALAQERFLVLPHPEVLTFLQRKTADYDRWLAGMRRLQARVASRSG